MNEIIFTYDTSLEKFKAHINNYRDRDIEKFIETLYIYIETLATQEMNERIHKWKTIEYTTRPVFETEMDWVKRFTHLLEKFLKNSWQINKSS